MRPLVLIAFVAGCTAGPPREPFIVRIAVWGPLGTFSPSGEGALASLGHPLVFERLATVDQAGDLKPMLASRIAPAPGGGVIAELRRGATFSDGTPVSADDIVRSLAVQGIRASRSGETLTLDSADPGVPVEALLVRSYVFREAGGKYLGSGPFALVAESQTEMRFVRRERRAGAVDEVWMVAYGSPKDAFSRTLKGDANALVDMESRWLDFFEGVARLRVVRGAGHGVEAIAFNGNLPKEERVRLARALESPRVRELAYGKGECAEAAHDAPAEDLPAGKPLDVLAWGPLERLALAARRALGPRGGEVLYEPPSDVLGRLKAGKFELVTLRPVNWPTTAIALIWKTGAVYNTTGYSNAKFDRAIAAKQWSLAREALREDPPAAFICTRRGVAILDSRIKDPTLGPLETLETLPQWEVGQ